MRTLELTKDTIQNILTDLLKRSPNNYTEFEGRVNDDLTVQISHRRIFRLRMKRLLLPTIR